MDIKPGEFKNLVEAHIYSTTTFAHARALGTKRNGEYQWLTYADFAKLTSDVRGGLAYHGVSDGDCVAIISDNSEEWAAAAYATFGLGAHFTPMYEKQLSKDWEYILRDSEAKVAIVANRHIYDTVAPWLETFEHLKHIVVVDAPEDDPISFKALIALGKQHPKELNQHVDPHSVASLIYTSGTTGNPKGVMLSHDNICSNINSIESILDVSVTDSSVCFLPWAHVFGQTCELHMMLSRGAAIGLVESITTILDNLKEIQPTILISVPRIFNRVYAAVQKKIDDSGALTQSLFNAAMANSSKMRDQTEKFGKPSASLSIKDAFYDRVVLKKIRSSLGGRLKYCFSGGAALSPEVARFIDNLHITVYEGYGLTETAPVSACNRPNLRRIGSVGIPVPGAEAKTLPTEGYDEPNVGELCVRGRHVMLGYFKQPELTKEVLDEDGWFRTGDLARIDKDGYIWLIGRVKEQYKLENGKYVVPALLEEQLQLSKYIMQAFIDGSNRRYNIALFVLEMPEVKLWAQEHDITVDSALFDNPKLHELIASEVEALSTEFRGYEKPKKWILTDQEMTTENDLLTPSLKVKRRSVIAKWKDSIDALYNES